MRDSGWFAISERQVCWTQREDGLPQCSHGLCLHFVLKYLQDVIQFTNYPSNHLTVFTTRPHCLQYRALYYLHQFCRSVRLSVCLSVCPSVTCWYPIQTNEHKITPSLLWGSKNTLVFWHQQWLGGGVPFHLKFALKVNNPPLKCADFDQYLLITSKP